MSTVTISTFSNTIEEFLRELKKVFPRNKTISVYKATLRVVNMTSPGSVVTSFMNLMRPHENLLRNENDDLMHLISQEPGMFKTMGLDSLWGGLSKKEEKDAIWKYLKTLYVIGMEIEPSTSSAPPLETLLPSPASSDDEDDGDDEDPMSVITKLFPEGAMEAMMKNAEKEFGDGKGGIDQRKVKKLLGKVVGKDGGGMAELVSAVEGGKTRRSNVKRIAGKNKNVSKK